MMKFKIAVIRLFLYLLGLFKGNKYRYSQVYEDNFKYMDLDEKLWWGYKALIRQIERAEKGKGIEEYFAVQDLEYSPGDKFIPEKIVSITAAGDLSASELIYPASTRELWDDIADFYFSGDIVCANLEAPLDSSKAASGVPEICLTAPDLNTTPEMFERFYLGGQGVNLFSTANNHSLDQGEDGLLATLDFLDKHQANHVGTSRTLEEQMDIPIIEKQGIKFAFLAYTYCLNGKETPPGKGYLINEVRLNKPGTDTSLIKQQVKIAREKGADMVICLPHWSVEFESYPLENIIEMGHQIMECGIDIILGGHPHVAQPMEKYSYQDPFTGQKKDGFIIYSLGELVSYNAFSKNSRLALAVKLGISKGKQNGNFVTRITDLQVLPLYTLLQKINGEYDYRVLNFYKLITVIEKGESPYDIDNKEAKELFRLKNLLEEKLLPQKREGLIYEG